MRLSNMAKLQETRNIITDRLERQGRGSFKIVGTRTVLNGLGELIILKQVKPKGAACFFEGKMRGDDVAQIVTRCRGGGVAFVTKHCTVAPVYGFDFDAPAHRRYQAALLVTVNSRRLTKITWKKTHKDCK